MKKYISVLLAEEQAKKHYVPKIGSIGMVIFTVLWIVLSLFAFHCSGVEAAVPKPADGGYKA